MVNLNLPKLDSYSYEPLREQVYNVLKNAVINGAIAPGQKIKETWVAEELNVSRTPVREALLMLELEDLIKISPQEGFIVQGITTRKQIRNLFQVREPLEGLVTRLASKNISPENLHQLESTVDLMRTKFDQDDTEDFLKFEQFYHRIIYKSADNEYLDDILNKLFQQINRFRSKSFNSKARMEEVLQELREINRHLQAKDAVEAEKAALKHLQKAKKAIIKSFEF